MTTILVADDISDNRLFLESLFRSVGYDVTSAVNGAEALALAQANPPDAIIADILMPVMDGFELCRRWKRDERLQQVPLVFYSATYTGSREERLALSLGADRFLLKPQQPEVLLAVMRDVLTEARARVTAALPLGEEMEALREYNTVLFSKLEKRVQQLHEEIEDRRRTELALAHSEARLRSILSAIRGGVVYVTASGEIASCNPGAERILGLTEAQCLGQRWNDAALQRIREDGTPFPVSEDPSTIALRTGQACGDVVLGLRRADGVITWVSTDARPLLRPGETTPYAVVVILNDITEQRTALKERAALEQQLRTTQKLEALGRLAGGIAHDFNNVLAVILGSAELALLRPELPEVVRADFETIRAAAERSSAITRQLLGFARQQAVAPRPLQLNDEISQQIRMLQRLLGDNVSLHWTPSTSLWPVWMDVVQFDQVLINLCANARDAIGDVGTIVVATSNVVIDAAFCTANPAATSGEFVRLSVRDTGSGMSDEVRTHIFDPFFTTKGLGKGTGLGLATVYGAVLQAGGFITVTSAMGQGTTFDLYLPRHTAAFAEAAAAPEAQRRHDASETILLVDDDEFLRRVVARELQSLGYTCVAATGGSDALRLADELGDRLDLVLTDMVMPDMGGRQLAAELARRHPRLKVLVMSGYADRAAGPPDDSDLTESFIAKPFSREAIGRKIREVLGAT